MSEESEKLVEDIKGRLGPWNIIAFIVSDYGDGEWLIEIKLTDGSSTIAVPTFSSAQEAAIAVEKALRDAGLWKQQTWWTARGADGDGEKIVYFDPEYIRAMSFSDQYHEKIEFFTVGGEVFSLCYDSEKEAEAVFDKICGDTKYWVDIEKTFGILPDKIILEGKASEGTRRLYIPRSQFSAISFEGLPSDSDDAKGRIDFFRVTLLNPDRDMELVFLVDGKSLKTFQDEVARLAQPVTAEPATTPASTPSFPSIATRFSEAGPVVSVSKPEVRFRVLEKQPGRPSPRKVLGKGKPKAGLTSGDGGE